MLREFIIGENRTGLLVGPNATVVGGEDPSLIKGPYNILPGETSILVGSATVTSYYVPPTATVAAWNAYFANATGN